MKKIMGQIRGENTWGGGRNFFLIPCPPPQGKSEMAPLLHTSPSISFERASMFRIVFLYKKHKCGFGRINVLKHIMLVLAKIITAKLLRYSIDVT